MLPTSAASAPASPGTASRARSSPSSSSNPGAVHVYPVVAGGTGSGNGKRAAKDEPKKAEKPVRAPSRSKKAG